MKAHPFAELFPLLAEDDLAKLAEDIRQHGQRDPIMVLDGLILDGRNREAACKLAGVVPKYEKFRGTDPLAYVLSKNLSRRHLTESQRATVAAKVANLQNGTNQHKRRVGGTIVPPSSVPATTKEDAAKLLNVSRKSVQRARKVIDKGVPQLTQAVESGEVSVNAAVAIAALPTDEQEKIVAGGADAIKQAAAEIRHKTKLPPPEPEEPDASDKTSEATAPAHGIPPTPGQFLPTAFIVCPHCHGSGHVPRPAQLSTATGMPPIPSSLDTPAFRQAWEDWHQERKRRKQPVSPKAAKLQLDKLEAHGPAIAIATILRSIESGWQGLFPEKSNESQQRNRRDSDPCHIKSQPGDYDHATPDYSDR